MLLVTACQQAARLPEFELRGATMGTSFSVKVVMPPADADMQAVEEQIRRSLTDIENRLSTYIEESELTQFNRNRSTDWVSASKELCDAVAAALEISELSRGAFDITVGPLVNLWGFGPDGTREVPPSEAEINQVLQRVDYRLLQTDCSQPAIRKKHPELYVDLSGWAKGFAADQLATRLLGHGIDHFLVEVGGEMRAQGKNADRRKWAVALEKPVAAGREVQTVVRISDAGIATSGDYRNFFEYGGQRYSHTIDPRSGYPVSHNLASVTVFADSAAAADALATALLVLGPDDGLALADELGVAAYFLLRASGRFDVLKSAGFETRVGGETAGQ